VEGSLNVAERSFTLLFQRVPSPAARRRFRKFDVNKDAKISREEFAFIMVRTFPAVAARSMAGLLAPSS
jgi:Ca2+-binding EF-hand superfamily protein